MDSRRAVAAGRWNQPGSQPRPVEGPLWRRSAVVGDVLGPDAARGELSMLGIWLVGQCLAFQQVRHLLPEREAQAMMDPKVRDAIAEVVYWLARAGLAAYRGGPEAALDSARLAV